MSWLKIKSLSFRLLHVRYGINQEEKNNRPIVSRLLNLPSAIFMTDTQRTPDPVSIVSRLPKGFGVIFRHYDAPNRHELAEELARLCRQRHITFLVAGDWALAKRVRADGVHLPDHAVRNARGLRNKNPHFLVTSAAHSQRSLWRAVHAGVDTVLVSPVFPTPSHPKTKPIGLMRFTNICKVSPIPVYALGGIGANNTARLQNSGSVGIAGISLFCS
jgi:thiamine-phosphate pyrophosphorylase